MGVRFAPEHRFASVVSEMVEIGRDKWLTGRVVLVMKTEAVILASFVEPLEQFRHARPDQNPVGRWSISVQ